MNNPPHPLLVLLLGLSALTIGVYELLRGNWLLGIAGCVWSIVAAILLVDVQGDK